MISQDSRQNLSPPECREMSTVENFALVGKGAVEREQVRSGVPFDIALARVARRIQIGPGTLSNIIRQRVKSVSFDLGGKLLRYAYSDLQRQIEHLEHEKNLLLGMGAGADDRTLGRVVRAIETVRQTLSDLDEGAQ